MRLGATLALAAVVAAGACSVTGEPNLLGGREKCWPESETRLATLMKGMLELDPARSVMHTPEGERFDLTFPDLVVKSDAAGTAVFDSGGAAVARQGELVSVFGGLGADRAIAVCAIEERHEG